MSRDVIEDLALIAHPQPRHGEVDPPEAFDDAAEQIAQHRQEYAENLRAMCEDTDEDPLLAELRDAAGRREAAESHIKALLAYGRHFTGGSRPGYSWPVLAEAAGLDRKTAERRVSDDDIAAVRAAVEAPAAQRWPQVVANLNVHRAYDELKQLAAEVGIDPPQDLEPDTERRWWLDQAEQLANERHERRIVMATHHWHNAWLRACCPRAGQYLSAAEQLRELAGELRHFDPARRHVPDELAQLDTLIETLTDVRSQLAAADADRDRP